MIRIDFKICSFEFALRKGKDYNPAEGSMRVVTCMLVNAQASAIKIYNQSLHAVHKSAKTYGQSLATIPATIKDMRSLGYVDERALNGELVEAMAQGKTVIELQTLAHKRAAEFSQLQKLTNLTHPILDYMPALYGKMAYSDHKFGSEAVKEYVDLLLSDLAETSDLFSTFRPAGSSFLMQLDSMALEPTTHILKKELETVRDELNVPVKQRTFGFKKLQVVVSMRPDTKPAKVEQAAKAAA